MTGMIGSTGFEELCGVVQGGRRGNTFSCDVYVDDPAYARMLAILAAHGLAVHLDSSRRKQANEFSLVLVREYDASDIEAAELLVPDAQPWPTGPVADDGRLQLRADATKPASHRFQGDLSTVDLQKGVSGTGYGGLVVSSEVKAAMLAGHVDERSFVPAELVDEEGNLAAWGSVGSAWWELKPDLVLPAQSSSAAPSGTNLETGSLVQNPPLVYDASSIEPMRPIVAAWTLEEFGPATAAGQAPRIRSNQKLVLGRPVYRIIRDLGLDVGWEPVFIL